MSAPTDSPMQRAPLEGVRVLDLTRVLAGPWCTQLLGDLGADVVKVEAPDAGDDSRQFGQALPGDGPGRDSGFFLACNRNKRSITVDLNTASGAALIARLAAESDVLVENFKAGGLRRFGLDAASLMPANPRLIYCSVTGFGQDGPYAKRPAYDFIMQAMAGLMSSCGQPEGAPGGMPMRTGIPTTDLVAGYQATVAILGALIQRGISGQGQFIDAAMLDSSVCFNATLAQAYLITGQPVARQGNQFASVVQHLATGKAERAATTFTRRAGPHRALAGGQEVQHQVDGYHAVAGRVVCACGTGQRAVQQHGQCAAVHVATAVGVGRVGWHVDPGLVGANVRALQAKGQGHGHGQRKQFAWEFCGEGRCGRRMPLRGRLGCRVHGQRA